MSNYILPKNGVITYPCPQLSFNTLGPRQNGRHFPDDIFKCIFLNENVWIPVKISLKFVPKGPINNTPALVQIMAWRRPGDKPLSEPMMVSLPTHICVTRPQWVLNNVCKGGPSCQYVILIPISEDFVRSHENANCRIFMAFSRNHEPLQYWKICLKPVLNRNLGRWWHTFLLSNHV